MHEEDILKHICLGGKLRDAAVKALYQGHAQPMLSFFVHQGLSADEAQDVLQECFVKVIRGAASFNASGSAKAWIWQIARNCLLDCLDKRSRLAGREVAVGVAQWQALEQSVAAPVCNLGLGVDACVAAGLEAFGTAMPDRAHALTLQMDGLAIEAIGHRLGRSVAATKEYLSQCRKKIQPFIAHCLELLAS
jgi:RNA polymerase sigma-70 factor (ECF subfamily)